jgi:hypothetical protein
MSVLGELFNFSPQTIDLILPPTYCLTFTVAIGYQIVGNGIHMLNTLFTDCQITKKLVEFLLQNLIHLKQQRYL